MNIFATLTTISITCFSIIVIVIAIVAYFLKKAIFKNKSLIPTSIFLTFIMLFLMNYRLYYTEKNTVFNTIFDTLRVFFFNGDLSRIKELASDNVALMYFWSAIYTFAPVLTITAVMSLFADYVKLGKKELFRYIGIKDVYVFSELNERSIILAKDISECKKKARIYFCDVFASNTENYYELKEKADGIKAVCLKQDVATENFRKKFTNKHFSKVNYFLLSNDETENLNQAVELINKYEFVSSESDDTEEIKKQIKAKNVDKYDNLYVFSSKVNYQSLNDKYYTKKINIKYRNTAESFVFSYANDNAYKIIQTAREEKLPYNDKKISLKIVDVLILGLGSYGQEMFKLLVWLCQLDGYGVRIHAFDKNPNAKSEFELKFPGLMDKNNNHFFNKIGTNYEINIHSGIDVNSAEFKNKLYEVYDKSVPTYAFVSLGDDETNINTARIIDRIFYQRYSVNIDWLDTENSKIKKIDAVVHNKYSCDVNQSDVFCCIGDYNGVYSVNNIISYEFERQGRLIHIERGYPEDNFWADSYSYRSSISEVFFKNVRNSVIDFDSVKVFSYSGENLGTVMLNQSDTKNNSSNTIYITDENAKVLHNIDKSVNGYENYAKIIERNRWCAYLLTEGFVTSCKKEKKDNSRKSHHQIRSFVDKDELDNESTPHFCEI